jgi:predicted transcriptional regulator
LTSTPEAAQGKPKTTLKPGVYEKDGKLIVVGEEYIYRVCSALASPTRIKILQQLLMKEADIGEISELIGQSKANASTQVKRLEEIGLVRAEYKPGSRGVRKVVKTNIHEIRIILAPEVEEV